MAQKGIMGSKDSSQHPIITILGAGITGIVLAHSLQHRQVPFQLFEQSAAISQHGAGLSFNPAGLRVLKRSSPAVREAYKAVAAGSHPTREDFYWGYVAPNVHARGHTHEAARRGQDDDVDDSKYGGTHFFELLNDGVRRTGREEEGHGAVRRSAFLAELVKRLPPNIIQFNKRIASITDEGSTRKLKLTFSDGTSTLSELVLGADGIKSQVRRYVLDDASHPSNDPRFSGFVAYRSLIRLEDAAKVMGPGLAQCAHFRADKGISYVSYPITGGEYNNLGIFLVQQEGWKHWPSVSASSSRNELLSYVEHDNEAFRELIGLLDEELDVWAVYDFAENQLPTFARGRAAILGDAAHASTPNLGSGAGVSIEDAVIVAELVHAVLRGDVGAGSFDDSLEAAMQAFSDTRLKRRQWLVKKSRELGVLNCGNVTTGREEEWDVDDFERQTKEGYHTVWRGQITEMIDAAKLAWRNSLSSTAASGLRDKPGLGKL